MKVAILGYARDGKTAYEYWNKDGNELVICDKSTDIEVPKGAKTKLGHDYLHDLDQFDVIVRTAGLPPHLISTANPHSPDILSKVTSNTDEFLKVSPTKNVIGVTGTKGKGTTCTLIAKMLEAAFAGQRRVHLGGNIGIPALELLKGSIKPDDWVVLEESSFQLIDQRHSPHIAVCLMVVREHMDWHPDMNEYVNAKRQIFANQTESDIAIYNAHSHLSADLAESSKGKKIPFMKNPGAEVKDERIVIDGKDICETKEVKLLGNHNLENVCAAITAVWQITQDIDAIKSVVTSFTGLEHRLEMVGEVNGVKYYDDSFGTTPETAMVAIEALSQPKIVILGGSDKGASYKDLAKVVTKNNVRHVLLIGQTAQKIQSALKDADFTNYSDGGVNMNEIVENAKKLSTSGDVVLLSPACASFGLFDDYKDRGEQFRRFVQALS